MDKDNHMKKRYFIPLYIAVSFFIIFLHIILLMFSSRLSMHFLGEEYGPFEIFIIRASGVLASILTGFIVAFPMGYFTRRKSILYGFALPLIGFIFASSTAKGLEMLIFLAYPQWATLFLSCGLFWYLGYKKRSKKLQSTS